MRTGGYYGAVFDTYWTGTTGRAIQAQGGSDAALLGAYLMSNAYANMLGLYPLPPVAMALQTSIARDKLPQALAVLEDTHFAIYDAATGVVWVYTMARCRLGLSAARPALTYDDSRVVTVNRLYEQLVDNPFLRPFYERYRETLHLHRLRSCEAHPQQLRLDLLAINKQSTDQQEQVQKITGAARRPVHKSVEKSTAHPRWRQPTFASFRLYAIIAGEALVQARDERDDTIGNVADHFKRLCASRRIDYTGDITTKAIAAVLGGRRR